MITVEDLYRSMATESLLGLRQAFLTDRRGTTDPHAIAFMEQRLRWIAGELVRRATNNEDYSGVPS